MTDLLFASDQIAMKFDPDTVQGIEGFTEIDNS